MRVLCAASLWLGAAMAITPLMAGDASGQFKAGGHKPIQPKFSAAYVVRDQFDAHKLEVEVILSEIAIDTGEATEALDPHTDVINQDATRDHDYILLWIRSDGSVSMNATYSSSMTQYLDKGGRTLKAELTTNTADKVAGHIFTPEPVKTMSGESYTADFHFSTDVSRAPSGTRLGRNGGDPGKALSKIIAALAAKDWAGISSGVMPDTLASFSADYNSAEENLKDALSSFGFWLPKKNPTITGGELRGTDRAVLEVEGPAFGDQKALYLVRMIRLNGKWLFDRGALAGMIGDD